MKVRTDFVTNSSSSSFIITFAKISNQKAKDLIIKNKWDEYVIDGEDLKERISQGWYEMGADWAGVYINNPKNVDTSSKYFLFEECYGDDCDFCHDDCYDYDIELDFFPQKYQDIFTMVDESNGFTEIQQGFGAGRNS